MEKILESSAEKELSIKMLADSPIFQNVNKSGLNTLYQLIEVFKYQPGDTIISEGGQGDTLYIIKAGEVDILKKNRRIEQVVEEKIAVLKPPECFGEMSLIDVEKRSASVRAKSETLILAFSREKLQQLKKMDLLNYSEIIFNIAEIISRRLRDANFILKEFSFSEIRAMKKKKGEINGCS